MELEREISTFDMLLYARFQVCSDESDKLLSQNVASSEFVASSHILGIIPHDLYILVFFGS